MGAPFDDGLDDRLTDSGAVYLFTFGDALFSAPVLQAILGAGYTGGKNISVPRLGLGDGFGSSVSLDGISLAVGAVGDDGFNDDAADSGAVYLFTFDSASFGAGGLARVLNFETISAAGGPIASGSVRLGSSVSLDANILAVGAVGDVGTLGSGINIGAVHIFNLGDAGFSTLPNRLVTIGQGYDGGNDIDLIGLSDNDRFGSAVALQGLELAVGSPGDDGLTDGVADAGAVFLFTFLDPSYAGGGRVASIGADYAGTPDLIPTNLGAGDALGRSLALQGPYLAAGKPGDDGFNDSVADAGAVYLFFFGGPGFATPSQSATIGADYLQGNDTQIKLGSLDGFGSAVALDGTRLVVGAPFDDGRSNGLLDAGAVHLFSIGNVADGRAMFIETLGAGYQGQNNLSVPGLISFSEFGTSVSLDGARLAVGVPRDAGALDSVSNAGAVYLFSFSDLAFGAPVLSAIIGADYTGGNNVAVALEDDDRFGTSVSLAGTRLAVGAPGDQGAGNSAGPLTGAVYLFSFSNLVFDDGTLEATLGSGYTGGKDIDLALVLESQDVFGSAVSLGSNSLAVGAPGDSGNDGTAAGAGAAYLFTFADREFNSGQLQARITRGLAAVTPNLVLPQLDALDNFGFSLALSPGNNRLFVGAPGDQGASNSFTSAGAVYQFDFSGVGSFAGGALTRTLGAGYTGGLDQNIVGIADFEQFGSAVAMDGPQLAIGSSDDNGQFDVREETGAVYLFRDAGSEYTPSGIIGSGYGDALDFPLASIGDQENFGASVTLNQNRLAVGSVGDRGRSDKGQGLGAVYLFSFTNNSFNGLSLAGTLGQDYGPQRNLDLGTAGGSLGASVALSGNRLAIGSPGDMGASASIPNVGAVYLLTFADDRFATPTLRGTIGQGYSGAGNFDVGELNIGDFFGSAVSLDGLRLAVGAPGDDGANEDRADSGAVYLFSFADLLFGSPVLEARMGADYIGGKNVNVGLLQADDQFGSSVSLKGNMLAVGAQQDDGSSNSAVDAGAVHLFTFTNSIFNGGVLEATLGAGYTGGKNLSIANLAAGDGFGSAVSLDGLNLIVGAYLDDGGSDLQSDSGAVYRLNFADSTFGGATELGIIGVGHFGVGNLPLGSLDIGDRFGSSVSLSNLRLAVGAPGDSGVPADAINSGAVYLFIFASSATEIPVQQATIGRGYGGGVDLSVPGLSAGDRLGSSVSIDGTRLVIGAVGDAGPLDDGSFDGAVVLLSFALESVNQLAIVGTIGDGYANGPISSLSANGIGGSDQFGVAVSLDGLRLAVGASLDDGFSNQLLDSGAVYLFSFADAEFGAPVLQSVLGAGYSGGKNLSMGNLNQSDRFGGSVSLSGNRLAVGADGDDGALGTLSDVGAVYLFSFADATFSAPSLQAIIGADYSGGSNLSVAGLDFEDFFGRGVALQGLRLAVGAPGDDGASGSINDSGAVHLFTFDSLLPSAITQVGTIGNGYGGASGIDLPQLEFADVFGVSVDLDGRRLVVGAQFDDGGVAGSFFDLGAVYGFTFADDQFGGGNHVSTIGYGYSGPNDFDVLALSSSDNFGASVALDGNRLAIGATQDDGAFSSTSGAGGVYLFTLADQNFGTPALAGTIGRDYSGPRDIALGLDFLDIFGASVSLDGNRLAVGALLDDGPNNVSTDTGGVYLFTFEDADFNDGRLAGTLGAAYRSDIGLDLTLPVAPTFIELDVNDRFGTSVSLDGNQLAIGAEGDRGSLNSLLFAGAVYLFSFADADFSGANLEAVIGHGYVGGKNLWPLGVQALDIFGTSVSLDGNRLAVGAPGDDGASDSASASGAVYLFSFTDALFSGGVLEATIGADYVGGKDINLASQLEVGDSFGSSVSLSGNALAVGAPGDAGSSNGGIGYGAVYLFSFADAVFSSGGLQATIGQGYTGGNSFNVALDEQDRFGLSVSLDGLRLAVGAQGDDGAGNGLADSGAAYLFTFADLAFNTPSLRGQVGAGYSGPGDVDIVLTPFGFASSSFFGTSVAIDGNRLAIGGPNIASTIASPAGSGAVYLLTFTDAQFGGGTIAEILASGAPNFGANLDFDVELDAFVSFGIAVSLDGNRLVVGANNDAGFDDALSQSGAVYLFTFADADFSGAQLAGRLGSGYTRGAGTPVAGLEAQDNFGWAVSLNGTRLAVGAPGDDGVDNSLSGIGAVYLFTFADADFAAPVLEGVIGADYTGGKNLSVSELRFGAGFGSSVSLDGNRLAVGAPRDAGALGSRGDSGAAYLFSFLDDAFASPLLESIIGRDYTGGKNFDLLLDAGDLFGTGISLSGTRLAVGAVGDAGLDDLAPSTGAVYLFNFATAGFDTPSLAGTIGRGYDGTDDLDLATTLEAGDFFGQSVSLDANRLAVGAPFDDGESNGLSNAGAAYLFTFADSVLSSPALARTVGALYAGANGVANLDSTDLFGQAISLSGNTLAVGAPFDRGLGNAIAQAGAVYLFGFADATFTADPQLTSLIGRGYTGGSNIDVAALDLNDIFGRSVSFDGSRLVVGATGDDGPDGLLTDSGAVYFFNTAGSVALPGLTFSDNPGADVTISAGALAAALSGGTAVELQANNDITVNAAILVNNPSGNGGNLTFRAGRSILINAGITTDDGDFLARANDFVSSGVVDGFRDSGDAVLSFGAGGAIDAGFGVVDLFMERGDDKTFSSSGAINLGSITASGIFARNQGSLGDRPVTINAGSVLTANNGGSGGVINIVSGVFTNNAGPGAINLTTAFQNFLIFSDDYDVIQRGGLTGLNGYNSVLPPISGPGGVFIFSRQPLLTFTADDATRTYGDGSPSYTFQFSGLVNGDTASYAFSGAPDLFDTASGNAGVDPIFIQAGTLVSDVGYGFDFVDGALTTLRALLTVTTDDATREYGLANPNFTASFSGLVNGDDSSVVSGLDFSTVADILSDVGTYSVTPFGASATNYDFSYVPGTLTITRALLTVTADDATREYGLANPTFTGSVTGFRNSDTASVISGLTFGTPATIASNVGTFAITGSGASATNYDFSYVPGTLTITRALLTVTADDATREYGLANPTFTGSVTGFRNSDTASVISGLTYGTTATIASNVGTFAITGSGASATNYDFSYVPGTLTITRALLTVTADDATREYGLANPTFTGSVTGFRNSDTASVISGLTYGTTATIASNVGTFAITGSGASATNYDFSYVPGTLTITRALLTVTADDATREYGLANPTFTGSVTGFRNSDTASVISGLTYGTTATIASNVGTFAITGSGASATNYDFSYAPGTLTITRALLTVTADDATREYGLANPTFTGSVTGFRNSDTASVISGLTYGTTATIASNVGTFAITGSGASATNYDFSYVPGTLTITRALLTVTADDATREYGLANPTFTGSVTGFRNSDTASVISGLTYGTTATIASNVGTFAITGSGASATNYDFSYVPGTLTITRALLTVTADDATREYGLANPTFTGSVTGFRNSDTASVISGLTYGTTATIASNVGTFAITGSGASATNYDFSYAPGTLTITRALLTVTADDATREYGLANPTFTGSVTGFRNSDTASVISGLTYGTTATIASNVGTFAITGSGASATNYDFSYVPGTLTITRALLTVTADDATREYGLANPTFTGSVTGFRNSDTASVISGLTYGTTATIASNVGTFAITGSGASATNYDFSYAPGTLTITRALLTVTADDATREYGLANPTFTGSVTGFRNSDTASVISGLTYGTTATIASNVGTFAITGSGASATNYDFSYVPGTLTITRALLTVTADDATREYGLANPTFTGSVTGFRNSDTASVISGLTYGTTATIASNVGTFAITGSGASATNYDFSYVPGTLTITRALLTVTADDATREYGLANPTFTGSVTGFRNSDTASVISGLTYGTTATIASNVGTFAITGSGASATNYDFSYAPGTLTITRALLTVTADDATREYGLANPTFTGSVTGFRNSDTASVISGLTYGTTATIASNVGTFAITGSGASATNYDFSYVPGTLTITRALLTVTADDATREYGLANPTFTGSVTGFRNSDTASVISGLTYGTTATIASNVGTFAITGSGASATNYDFSYAPGTLTITRALLTVTADDATREYGLANPTFTGSVTGFRNSDTASVISGLTYGTTATIASNVGTFAITGSGASATNYDFSYVPGTLTITRALLTVTADDATREYGLANPTFTGSVTGFRNSDTASVISGLVYGTSATIASNVGTFAITGSGASATNYDFSYVPGTLTITRALLTVTADDATREYGLANPVLTATIAGLRNGDAANVVSGLALTTSATAASNVGSYAINVTGGSALNYDFAYVPGTLSVARALLTVTIDSKTRVYGAFNPELTASITGFRNGDTADVVTGLRLRTGAIARSNAGDYLITGSGASAANYRFAYSPGTLTITKALLQVRADNASREYGLENPAFTARITGFRNGDTAAVISGLVLSSNATIGSDVGVYAITASGGSALNYDFVYSPGRLVIDQARLLITANSIAMEQGSGDPVLTVTYSGLRNGDTADVVTGLVLRSSGGGTAEPGQYIINASRGTARNYQITYRPGVMTVMPAIVPPAQDPPAASPPGSAPPPPATKLPDTTPPPASAAPTDPTTPPVTAPPPASVTPPDPVTPPVITPPPATMTPPATTPPVVTPPVETPPVVTPPPASTTSPDPVAQPVAVTPPVMVETPIAASPPESLDPPALATMPPALDISSATPPVAVTPSAVTPVATSPAVAQPEPVSPVTTPAVIPLPTVVTTAVLSSPVPAEPAVTAPAPAPAVIAPAPEPSLPGPSAPVSAAPAVASAIAPAIAMPSQGSVSVAVPPEALMPSQILQGMAKPLPVIVSPETQPGDATASSGASQGDGQEPGCQYISLCSGALRPLWTYLPQ